MNKCLVMVENISDDEVPKIMGDLESISDRSFVVGEHNAATSECVFEYFSNQSWGYLEDDMKQLSMGWPEQKFAVMWNTDAGNFIQEFKDGVTEPKVTMDF